MLSLLCLCTSYIAQGALRPTRGDSVGAQPYSAWRQKMGGERLFGGPLHRSRYTEYLLFQRLA